jgi:hypothetical protein
MAGHNDYHGPISFMVDRGNTKAEQIRVGFDEMAQIPAESGLWVNLGELDFRDDDEELALQAADLVCWGAHQGRRILFL